VISDFLCRPVRGAGLVHVARLNQRMVVLATGDGALSTTGLIGGNFGFAVVVCAVDLAHQACRIDLPVRRAVPQLLWQRQRLSLVGLVLRECLRFQLFCRGVLIGRGAPQWHNIEKNCCWDANHH